MTRYDDDQYVQDQYEINRRLEIAAEQEPSWMHARRRPQPRRRRYFSRLIFRPIRVRPQEDADDAAA